MSNVEKENKPDNKPKSAKEIKSNKKENMKNILTKSVDILALTSTYNIIIILTIAIFSFIIYISQNPTIPIILIVISNIVPSSL